MMRFLSDFLATPALVLALLGLCLGASMASAQVPHDMNYQGRLVDAVGAPLAGPVDFEIRVHEFIDLGFALYEEYHAAVALDDEGGFNVRIGTGTPITGTFDASLFAGVNRYLEVVIDGEVLSPRLPISSVPYAMVAEGAVSLQGAPTIVDDIAANAAGISSNNTDIAANGVLISQIVIDITDAAAGVSSNDADIAANTSAISTNTIALSARAAADAMHDADIATNVAAISSNTTNISANATSISANTSAIAGYPDAAPTTGYHAFGSDGESHRVWDAETGIAWHDSPNNQLRSLGDHNTYLAEVINGGKSNGTDFACLSDGCNLQLPALHQLENLAQDCVSVAVFGQDDGLWSYTGAQASHCASVWPDPSLGQPGNCTWSRTIDAADPTQAYAICIVEGQSLTATIVVAALSAELPLRGCGGMSLMEAPSSLEPPPQE